MRVWDIRSPHDVFMEQSLASAVRGGRKIWFLNYNILR